MVRGGPGWCQTGTVGWYRLEILHDPGNQYGQQEGSQKVGQGGVQDSAPNEPEVKVEPCQGARAEGLLTTVIPAPFVQFLEDGDVT